MPDPLRVLGVDPSSTKTGFALLSEGPVARHGVGELLEWGLVKGVTKDPATLRARQIAAEMVAHARRMAPDVIVIETPSGKVARNKRGKTQGAGLSVYGFAAGQVDHALWNVFGMERVVMVNEIDWTGGAKKQARASRVELLHPGYDRSKDSGMDAADAIGLAGWYLAKLERERRIGA